LRANSSPATSDTCRPIVTTWKATTSTSPDSWGRQKSDRHRCRSRRWRGKLKRQRSSPVDGVQDDQVVALGHGREVAVHDGGLHDPLGLHLRQQGAQPRPALGLDELLVGRARAGRATAQPHWPRNSARSSIHEA
jgi:hypothetical protein